MNMEHAEVVGLVFLGTLGLLSGYLLALRIKEYYEEKPDPKVTYARLTEVDKLRVQLDQFRRDWRADYAALDAKQARALASAHELIRKNAEHVAALITESRLLNQRLSEVGVKIDRLQERGRS